MNQDLQSLNKENRLAVWTAKVKACRESGLTVKEWCSANEIAEATYYGWQRKVFSEFQKETTFVDITPVRSKRNEPAATIRIGRSEADIYSNADASLISAICQALKSC